MALRVVVALALFVAAASATRIVGGEETSIEEHPSLVQIDFRATILSAWSQSCAGTLLTTTSLVTAAQCFHGLLYRPENRRIRAGSSERNTGGELANVNSVLLHPNYATNVLRGFDADIALVRVANPFTYTDVIQPGTIAAHGTVLPDGFALVHAGWGATEEGGEHSPVLRDGEIHTINNALCRERYLSLRPIPGIVTENMICAGLLDEGGRGACEGDAGGPLYAGDILVGIWSWGHGCANETFPSVSTAVGSYTNWIVDNAV